MMAKPINVNTTHTYICHKVYLCNINIFVTGMTRIISIEIKVCEFSNNKRYRICTEQAHCLQ